MNQLTRLVAFLGIVTVAAHAPAQDWPARGAEVVGLVRDQFFDAARGRAWAAEHARYAQDVRDDAGFAAATRQAIGRLNTSHTSYYTPDDPEYYGLRSIFRDMPELSSIPPEWDSIGVDVDPGHHVRVAFAGSPAAAAGLKRGDRILLADGREFHPVRAFRGRSGRPVALTVQSRRDGPTREVVVVPRRVEPRREWLDAQTLGARVVEREGRKVAYMPLFSAAGEPPEAAVRAAIQNQFDAADALILDFRNGWGGANPSFVGLFDRSTPVLEFTGRDGKPFRFNTLWRKPLFLLVNGGSRSGKEVVADAIQRHRLGTLVGTRTAGAVVGGRPFLLGDRSLLFLAVGDVRVDGRRLEGLGVSPDVEVAEDLPFADGADPPLERALQLAAAAQ